MAKKNIVLAGTISIILFYIPVLCLSEDTMLSLTEEDGLYESLGALFFLLASIVFLVNFSKAKSRNVFFLLFALAFFFAAGEEISWGQRILNLDTPPAIEATNAQKELTVHNLNIFQHEQMDLGVFLAVKELMNFNHLFILFWVAYCILVPLANKYASKSRSLFLKIRLPIVSIWLGMLFLLIEITCKALESYMAVGQPYGPEIYEIKESLWALAVLLMAVYFFSLEQFPDRFTILRHTSFPHARGKHTGMPGS